MDMAAPTTSSTAMITTPYQSATRERIESLVMAQHIAGTAPGFEQGVSSRRCEFATQALDVDVDDVRERIVRLVPDVLRDVGAPDHLACMPGEILEEGVFAGRE